MTRVIEFVRFVPGADIRTAPAQWYYGVTWRQTNERWLVES